MVSDRTRGLRPNRREIIPAGAVQPDWSEEDEIEAISSGESDADEDYVDQFAYYSEDKDEWLEPDDEEDDEEDESNEYDVNPDDRDDWS